MKLNMVREFAEIYDGQKIELNEMELVMKNDSTLAIKYLIKQFNEF